MPSQPGRARGRWLLRESGLVVLAALLAACGGDSGTGEPPGVATVTVSPATASLLVGQTQQLAAATKDASGNALTGRTVTWATSAAAVATVSAAGLVTAVGGGSATITATSEGVNGTAAMAVTVPVATVTVSPATATLAVGQTQQLTAAAKDVNGNVLAGRVVTWATSAAAVATVSNTGLVTALSGGPVTITAASEGKNGTAALTSKTFTALANGVESTLPVTVAGDAQFFSIDVPAVRDSLVVSVYVPAGGAGSGDPNLSVYTAKSLAALACSGAAVGADQCRVTLPSTGTFGIKVSAGTAFSGYAVRARHDGVFLAQSVTAGYGITCALTSGGAAYCWGVGDALGDGTMIESHTPVPVAGGLTFASVTAGFLHACGLTSGGVAYCWGGNWHGGVDSTPAVVAGGLNFVSLSAGDQHTCGIAAGGQAYCWGLNGGGLYLYGWLGDGTAFGGHPDPWPVVGGTMFASITAGYANTCALTSGGAAYCWGANSYGEAGDGSALSPKTTPVPVMGGLTFSSIVLNGTGSPAATAYTCATTAAGPAYCWGSVRGTVGDSSYNYRSGPVVVPGGLNFAHLSAGVSHVCGLTTGGTTRCWGDNSSGQMGDGTTSFTPNRLAPGVPVAGGRVFTSIASGERHTCGLTTAGALYCWGNNYYGQLGDGTTTDRNLPVAVRAP